MAPPIRPVRTPLRTRRPLGVGVVALLVVVAGCAPSESPPSRTLRFGWSEPVATLEPPQVRGLADQQLIRLLYMGLTLSDGAGALQPGLAEQWSSTDARTWRFVLRPGVTFTDGTPVTSSHVVAAWTALGRSAGAGPAIPLLVDIEGMAEVMAGEAETVRGLETPDDRTLVVTLRSPRAAFPFVVSRAEYVVKAPGSTPTNPVGSGRWRWVRGLPGDSLLVLVRADSGWDPGVDTLELRVTPPAEVATLMGRGVIDCVDHVLPGTRTSLLLQPDVSLRATRTAGLARLALRGEHPELQDPRVRRALTHALDLPSIARGVGESSVLLGSGRIPEMMAGSMEGALPPYYDPPLARRLLQEAGVDSLSLRLSRLPYSAPGDTLRDFLYHIRDYWEAVGVRVEIVQPEDFWRGLLDGVVDAQPQYVFGSFPDGPEFLGNLYSSAAPAARLGPPMEEWPRLDAILDTARMSMDPERRSRLLQTADSLLAEETPDIQLWQVPIISARRTAVPSCAVGLYGDDLREMPTQVR